MNVMRNGFFAMVIAALLGGLTFVSPAAAAEKAATIDEHMDALNDAYKKVKKQAADASQNKASAALAVEMQKHTVLAKVMSPERAAKESDKVKFMTGYQKAMNALLVELVNLENAFLDGNNAAAEASLKKINDMKVAEHKNYQVE